VEFEVANTHLDERVAANRAASARQLVEWLDPAVPTVVLGQHRIVARRAIGKLLHAEAPMDQTHEHQCMRLACRLQERDRVRNGGTNLRLSQHALTAAILMTVHPDTNPISR
jgi:hypothetical protein